MLAIATTLAALCAAVPTARADSVLAAGHHGRIDGAVIRWVSVWIGPEPIRGRVELARPLDPAIEVGELAPRLRPIRDAEGALIAFEAELGAAPQARWVIELRQPIGAAPLALAPALIAGVDQRISIEGPSRFEPDPALGFESYVGYSISGAMPSAARHQLDDAIDPFLPDPGMKPLYVAAGSVVLREHGLMGSLRPRGVSTGAALAVGGLFALVVGMLFGVYRRLQRRVEVERAEAVMDAEFRRL